MAAAASETEDGCVPRGTVVGGEVCSDGVHRHRHISLVWRSGVDAFILFCIPSQTEGAAYSIVVGSVLYRWRRTLLVAEVEAKRGVDANCEEV